MRQEPLSRTDLNARRGQLGLMTGELNTTMKVSSCGKVLQRNAFQDNLGSEPQ